MSDATEAAVQALLRERPDLEFFYILSRQDSAGSTGYTTFHSLAADPQACRAAIERLCAEQKAECDQLVAELRGLPEEEQPYDPSLPAGCSVSLCIVVPDGHQYVQMLGQSWNNWGQTFHSPLIPSIFDVAYYLDKVRYGEYSRHQVRPLPEELVRGPSLPWIPELVHIPAGPFLMGSSDADPLADNDEKPQHLLELPDYWIGRVQVTNAQFRPFVEGDGYANPAYWPTLGWSWRTQRGIVSPPFWDRPPWNGPNRPVLGIAWVEAVAYCRWLSAQTGRAFRLPTEAEWEKAARGPQGRIWPWGDTWDAGRCNSKESGLQHTTPVDHYPEGASPYGLLNMAGNVTEWCSSERQKPYPFRLEDEWTEEYLERDVRRTIRGGSWSGERRHVRGAYRYYYLPRHNDILTLGLRVASSQAST